jgi:hypothetical protein
MGRVRAECPNDTGRADPGVSAVKEWRHTGDSLFHGFRRQQLSQGLSGVCRGVYEYLHSSILL